MAMNFLQGVLGGSATGPTLEPQRANNALLHITDVPGIPDQDLVLALASFPIPKVNNGMVEIGYLNEKRKFAGLPTFDDLSVIYHDYVNLDKPVADALLQWRHQVYNPHTGAIGLAATYKKSGFVQLFAPDGTLERQYDLLGVWPSGWDPGDVDMMGEEALRLTVTLTIDKAKPAQGFQSASPSTKGAAGGATAGAQGAAVGPQ
jgi:hypothetical protein